MKERPILFSAPMVRAILEGRKTVTRRICKPFHIVPSDAKITMDPSVLDQVYADYQTPDQKQAGREYTLRVAICLYGQPGDRLWVRETCAMRSVGGAVTDSIHYAATPELGRFLQRDMRTFSDSKLLPFEGRWTPSIHMPRWASRITLEVTGVRVERLQDITETAAISEGIRELPLQERQPGAWWCADPLGNTTLHCRSPRAAFARLWESINGTASWNANPWVWVVEFKRVLP